MTQQKHSSFRPRIAQLLGGVALMTAVLIGSGAAEAQVPAAQTGVASPGRVEEQIKPQRFERRAVPNVETTQTPLIGAPEGAEKITFKLDKIVIEGVTVYKEGVLRKLYADRIGQTISLADLYGIAADMTRKYRNDGYILTQVVVPPQTIEGGTAHLNIIEGYVDQVNVALEEGQDPRASPRCA